MNKERELKHIQNQRDNKLILFGDGFPKLVAEIEKNYQKVIFLYLICRKEFRLIDLIKLSFYSSPVYGN